MGPDPRRLADDRQVDMVDPPAARLDQAARMFEEQRGGGATPLRVARREVIADIALADRPEQSVGEGVEDDVGVAVA
jgi:hypothetical protein